ncbi:MAG: flagellar filament capping protein FliD, partial [Planctomycetota bacterium]|nr:flagellar filament capping protein FliD [Planctomycetota bacterium]
MRTIAEAARGLLGGMLPGTQAGTDAYTLASDIGLSIDRYGTLSLDSTKLGDALASDYAGVLKFIGGSGEGRSTNQYVQYTSATSSTVPGKYNVEVTYDNSGNATSARIRPAGSSDWVAMTIQDGNLIGLAGTASQGLLLTAIGLGAEGTTQTADVYVQQGLAGQIHSSVAAMLKPDLGTIDVSEKRLETQLTSVKAKIDEQNKYLDKLQTTLKDKYARLEAQLADMANMQGQISALLSSVTTTSSSKS